MTRERCHRHTNCTSQAAYARRGDLSGSVEGAGGIGGLLGRSHSYASTNRNWYTHNCYHADGNGNITVLGDQQPGLAASYRYDPFGNLIGSSGSLAEDNLYRFSSKMYHWTTATYYYGYRWYAPFLHRWLNRDPIQESGGLNLYRFLNNDPTRQIDPFGLECPPFELPSRGPLRLELPKKKKKNRFTLGLIGTAPEQEPIGTFSIGEDWELSLSGDPDKGSMNARMGGPIGGADVKITGSPTSRSWGGSIEIPLGGGFSIGGSFSSPDNWQGGVKLKINF